MNVYSCKDPFLFMIIITCSALLSQSVTEITKDNCKNNRTFLSECSFNISFQPPLTEKLDCFLTFSTKTLYSELRFEIFSLVEEPKRIYSFCGKEEYPFSIHFNHFTLAYIQYNNDGLVDSSTIIKMQLRLETCDELKTFDVKDHLSWIIILSVVGFIVLIIVCAVIVYRYRLKRNEKVLEADVPLCVPVEGGSGKDRDMGHDSFASVKCSKIVEGKW